MSDLICPMLAQFVKHNTFTHPLKPYQFHHYDKYESIS